MHGLVTFSTSERARAFTYTLVTWPNELYPEGADPPFIAPFYAETDFRAGEPSVMEPARLYYRVLTRSTAASDTQARVDTGTNCCFWRMQEPSKSVADPVFPQRWCANPRGGAPTLFLAKFLLKTALKLTKLDSEGARL